MIGSAESSFAAACGLTGPLVLGVQSPDPADRSWRTFAQPFAVVGRDPRSDLPLDSPELSRRHAYLQAVAGRIFCVDLHSRTGTHWTDDPGRWGWVSPEATVRIGPYLIRPGHGDGSGPPARADARLDPTPPEARSADPRTLPGLTVEVIGRTGTPASRQASGALILVGRSPTCKVQLADPAVANIHAGLVRTAVGVYVVDLLKPGGIRVNGASVRWARLGEHDEVTVGDHTIRVHEASTSAPRTKPVAVSPGSAPPPRGSPPSHADQSEIRAQPLVAEPLAAGVMDVLQSIVALQQEQITLLRGELAEIRRLTVEQHDLRAALVERNRADQSPRVLRVVAGESRARTQLAVPVPQPGSRPGRSAYPLAIEGEVSPAGNETPPSTGAADDDNFDAQVFDRLTQIQGERLNRWQRLRATTPTRPVSGPLTIRTRTPTGWAGSSVTVSPVASIWATCRRLWFKVA